MLVNALQTKKKEEKKIKNKRLQIILLWRYQLHLKVEPKKKKKIDRLFSYFLTFWGSIVILKRVKPSLFFYWNMERELTVSSVRMPNRFKTALLVLLLSFNTNQDLVYRHNEMVFSHMNEVTKENTNDMKTCRKRTCEILLKTKPKKQSVCEKTIASVCVTVWVSECSTCEGAIGCASLSRLHAPSPFSHASRWGSIP